LDWIGISCEPKEPLMEITRAEFDNQRRPRFGRANPERMRFAFWEWMSRGDDRPAPTGTSPFAQSGFVMRDSKLKSTYGPWRARDIFNIPTNRVDGPIWTFDRMGATRTELPDGRVICVGGEHEDSYDPDFCIYNDVVVFHPTGEFEIYGYPRDQFLPTDFHTAALVGGRIIIIGCLGYCEERRPGVTPVYALDLSSYEISRIETSGNGPGWISEHEADLSTDGTISIRGGRLFKQSGNDRVLCRNVEDFALDDQSWVWRRVTDRNWPQFAVSLADGCPFVKDREVRLDQLLATKSNYTALPCETFECIRIAFDGAPVLLAIGTYDIEIMAEGGLSPESARQLAEDVRANVETAIGQPCVIQQV
jgi:hypothetical protein